MQSSTELDEPTVAQPLFAPSGPARRAPLDRRSENIRLERAWAPLNPPQHGRIDPSSLVGTIEREQPGLRPHTKVVVEISDGAVVSPLPGGWRDIGRDLADSTDATDYVKLRLE